MSLPSLSVLSGCDDVLQCVCGVKVHMGVTAGSELGCVTVYTRLHHLCFWSPCSTFTSDPLRNQQQLSPKVRDRVDRCLRSIPEGSYWPTWRVRLNGRRRSQSPSRAKQKKTSLEMWLWSISCDLRSRGLSEGNHLRFICIRLFNRSGSMIVRSKI